MKKFYNVSEFAEIMEITAQTVYDRIDAGKLPFKEIGGVIYIPHSVLENYSLKKRNINVIIAFFNQKGGCGKSTSVINLAAYLSTKGYKVLVVDNDPQAHATSGLIEPAKIKKTTWDVYALEDELDTDAIFSALPMENLILQYQPQKTNNGLSNIYVLPSSLRLTTIEGMDRSMFIWWKLKEYLVPLKRQFDYILIDCPPSFGIYTHNALNASDFVLVPVDSSSWAIEGLVDLAKMLIKIKRKHNPTLEVLGVFSTLYRGVTKQSEEVRDVIRGMDEFDDKIINAVIRQSVRLQEAPAHRQTIFEYDPTGNGSLDYKKLGEEVLACLNEKA